MEPSSADMAIILMCPCLSVHMAHHDKLFSLF